MNPVSAYIDALHKYFDYQGTVSRREYWMFVIAAVVIQIGSIVMSLPFAVVFAEAFLDHEGSFGEEAYALPLGIVGCICFVVYIFAVALPGLALMARRLNDMGWSRWWLVLVIVFMIPYPRLISFIPGMSFITSGLSYIPIIIFGCVPSKQ